MCSRLRHGSSLSGSEAPESLLERLRRRTALHPERVAYRFLKDGESEERLLTYGELDLRARALGARLQTLGAAGERALLLYPPGLELIVAFLGCLYARTVAVPAHPPRLRRRDARLQAILEDARPRFVLSSRIFEKRATLLGERHPRLAAARWLMSEEIDPALAAAWNSSPEPRERAGTTAFLQYTSGSTSSPKGVEISHGNLAHNERMIERAFGQTEASVIVGWLPPYHDMGLIGMLLQPLWVGATCVQMSPASFLRRPRRWLEAISRYRATTSGGPDFAYELCARKIDPRARPKLDLSSWKVAFSGAEPVRAATLERFAEVFAPCGFRPEAFYPCYGLAEATLLVSGGEVERPPALRRVDAETLRHGRVAPPREDAAVRTLVSCGRAQAARHVVVVDPDKGTVRPPGTVGEIWVAGESVAGGYFERPEDTAAVFGARLAEGGEEAFLRTGDLGFIADGELFVTGRLKDLIILRGRNHYPQDIELTAERSHPALRAGGGAAFTIAAGRDDGDEERLVVVHEIDRHRQADTDEIVRAITLAVAEEHEVTVHAVHLLPPGLLPKTSSGKVRRRACRADLLAGRLETVAGWERTAPAAGAGEEPRTPLEELLAALWAEAFERQRVGIDESFFELGGDSLRAMQLLARIENRFGVTLDPEDLFAAPTVAALAERLEAADVLAADPSAPAPQPAPGDARPAPLSFAQRRLWFLHQLDPSNPVHNIAAVVALEGTLAVHALKRALGEISRRHGALRTRFTVEDGEPVQIVEAPVLALPQIDLGALGPEERRVRSRRIATVLARRPFDLGRAAQWRAGLVRHGASRHELVLAFHHIIADGGSLDIFFRELETLYAAFRESLPSPLPEPESQYAELARWQRRTFDEARLAADLTWWRGQLAGEPAATELATDRPRPAVLSHRGTHFERSLPAGLIGELGRLAEASGATLFMALLAGFKALLHRVTGARDLVVGSPVDGRHRRELEGIIGVFINNLVLRTRIAGPAASYAELLGRVRTTALGAYAHQELPFEKLVEALQPGVRDLSRTPLFQLLFVGQNAPLRPARLPGLTLRPRETDPGAARFDLAVAVAPLEDGWLGTWKYSTDLFDATTVARLAGQLENLLLDAARHPHRPLRELRLSSAAEHHQALREWNDTRRRRLPGQPGLSLHELLAAQAERSPRATALVCGAERLSYRELERRTNALAWRLRELGTGPESRVGIFLERSLEMVIALVGTLKAGGAYVPFDPEDPEERLAFMVADAGVAVVLSASRLAARLPRLDAALVCLDAGSPGPAAGAEAPPPAAVRPHNAAYMIYTSGSTGRPKGVVVSHAAIVNRLLWMQEAYGLGAADRVLQKTPHTFDVSVWEFFWPLLTGARLVMAPPGAHRDGRWLADLVREHGITTLHFVPSMLRAFLETADLASSCSTLKRVITSGEALSVELRQRALARLPGELHNLYGPTEAAVDVTFHPCAPARPRHAVPIGRPITNIRSHVLDARCRPLPVGAVGVLHLGGVGLARGYFGRPALTAERFIPDPTADETVGRLYDTGDLARWRADGELEFLGRIDHQIKIRGFRVELGEIEAALGRHPGIHQAAVVTRDGAAGPRLIAWLAAARPESAESPGAAELRHFLRPRLPEHMVPSAFVFLEHLPKTSSGKIDRKHLSRRPLPAELEKRAPHVAPRTALERHLTELFETVLDVETVGVHDSFFELGGDSIRGAMMINRLQQELGEIIYVMALFDAPSPAELAAHLEQRYDTALTRRFGGEAGRAAAHRPVRRRPLDEGLAALREAVARRLGRAPGETPQREKAARQEKANPPAVFLLSPFRSGSTLLRVMLDGHSKLFAPPELELLGFDDLAARRAAFDGRDSFALEGLLRTVMELRGTGAEGARELLGRYEAEATTSRRLYRLLQDWIGGDRLLVDKTPSYGLDRATLERAETWFTAPRYIHLVRHPQATIHSYVEARMDRVYDFPFPPREQAELVWLLAHRNILDVLARVPEERQIRVRFEDLVRAPRDVMARISHFLGLELEPAMLEPYAGRRMTDGLGAESRMMGDPKFHRYQGIETAVAERWREAAPEWRLTAAAARLARAFGYEIEETPAEAAPLPWGPRPRDFAGDAPLSFAQERLWFLDRLDPGSPVYNMPAVVHLAGRLDAAALAGSFDGVRKRHEVLRMSFPERGGEPVQRLVSTVPPALPVVDLGGLEAAARDAESRRQALREGRRSFELQRGPMLRSLLLRLREEEHLLLVTMHHIVSDGWSIGILIRELTALYRQPSRARISPVPELPELPVQYADYAVWQRRWLESGELERHLAYWRDRLAGPAPALALPTDRPRPARLTFRGARRSRTLPREDLERVRSFGHEQGSTLFHTLLAAFKALLYRYTRQRDLWIGVPHANRNRAEVENLIGFFLNMVVARTDLSGRPSFDELLERVAAGFVESLPHQEAPFEKVVEMLQPERDPSRSPLFQVQFSLQNTPGEPLELPGLTLRRLEIHNGTTKFDLTVFLFDEPEGLVTTLEYNTNLFDSASMGRLLGHWQTLLCGAVAAPERSLAELPLLSAAELGQLLREWGQTRRVPLHEPCLHRLFEARVDEAPDAVAVIYEVEELLYRELDERANQLAHRLRALGVEAETRVGLALEPGLELVVAMVAILKAGGAYVPLDPSYPPRRLAFMVDDALLTSGPALLVTESRFLERFAEIVGTEAAAGGAENDATRSCRIFCLDAERQRLAEESRRRPRVEVGGDNLAYVIYTSGSTGQPKGVLIPHANAARLFAAAEPVLGFGPDDVWTLFHSHAFDFSVWEIWGALAYGGSLVVVPRELARTPPALYELLATEGVSVLNQTPSAFRQLTAAEAVDVPGRLALRLIVFGGEALELAALAPWIDRHGDAVPELVNMYGITETTVHVTHRRIRERDLGGAGISPIGTALPDLEVHLLGPETELQPAGVPGEIHVGGPGLARGYLARPALTAERFVPDPFAGEPGGRLYKSGDLARWRHDGDLEYLGRIDHQVKIRGYRIELGEIEAALGQHPEVRQAVVTARRREPGEAELIAYLLARGGELAAGELRRHLAPLLPDHMIPRAFLTLERWPLTPTGKLDRQALPDPGSARPHLERGPTAPRTPLERRLAEIWRDVLGLESVGIHDDFFELGGHSLLATRVISRVRESLGVEIRLHELFEAPTIASLAAGLEGGAGAGAGEALDGGGVAAPAITPGPLDGDLPLSFSQERLYLLAQMRGGESAAFNLFAPLHLTGRLAVDVLEASLGEIVRRHAALRTIFAMVEGQPVQRVSSLHPRDGGPVLPRWKLPLVDLGAVPEPWRGETARELVREESRRPFDVEVGPLFRAFVLRLGAEEHLLLLDMHHIVSDGWSMGVMVQELNTIYRALLAGQPSPLAPLPLQYADFARWQREWLRGVVREEHLAYWRGQFRDGGQALELPTDRPRPPVKGFRGGHRRRRLASAAVERLEAETAPAGATRFMLMLTALAVLLRHYSGQDDVTIGTFIANRNRAETEGLIGFFVNNLALRIDLRNRPSFRELLARVRDLTLAAYAHQDLPFEKLLAELELGRTPDRTPLFQVMLVLQNAPMAALDLPGLECRLLEQERGRANFDLTLWVEENLEASLEYDRELFDAATAQRMVVHFENLLASAGRHPGSSIDALSPLSPAERHQLLRAWNDNGRSAERVAVHDRIARRSRDDPEAVAVRTANEALTRGELEARAARLAGRLRSVGVGPDRVVALFVERGLEMIVALLGTLKAGGAYLPLDPLHPRERLALLLDGAPVVALLTQEHLAARLPSVDVPVLHLDRSPPEEEAAGWRETGDLPAVQPRQLAYLIYTSGSTGRPKAVMVSHGALANYTRVAARNYGLSAADRVLQFAAVTFDASAEEIFPTLAEGATLVLRDEESVGSATAFVEFCERWRPSVLNLPTAFWHEIAAELAARTPPPLRLVIIGGEPALPERVRRWQRVTGGSPVLFNTYGPTEATIVATAWKAHLSDVAPVGRPVGNVRTYVVDRGLRPVPLGARGELLIGGTGLARGYLGRPGRTAERFVPDPFSGRTEPGARLYRTGDLARHLPATGELDFQGRDDHQVKVRGYRIELGEVETALAAHPAIAEPVVVAEPVAGGQGHRLIAYAVGEGEELAVGELRDFLAARLPRYMIPAAFVVVDEIPRTATGKLDRRALPRPATAGAKDAESAAPRSEVEERLAAVWSEVLGIETVGVEDNFFELGGDSILGIRVVTRAREAGLELAPNDLFQFQTIAELARKLGPLAGSRTSGSEIPLTPAQRDFFETGGSARTIDLELPVALEPALLAASLALLAARHDALRLRFSCPAGQWRQEAAARGEIPHHRIDLSALAESRQSEAWERATATLAHRLEPALGPLSRAAHFDLGRERGARLSWSLHPLVADEVSERLLAAELDQVYDLLASGESSSLASGTASFERWATLLEERAGSPELVSAPPQGVLPRDRPEQEPHPRAARTIAVGLDAQDTRALLSEIPRIYPARVDEIVLCAVVKSFAAWTGEAALLLELETSHREDLFEDFDFSRTVGQLTRRRLVWLDLGDAREPEAEIAAVKKQVRAVPLVGGIGSRPASSGAEVVFSSFEPLAPELEQELSLFRPVPPPAALPSARPGPARLLRIRGEIREDRLRIGWTYMGNVHHEETIAALVESFRSALDELIEHCLSGGGGVYAPEDFPEANLSQEDLDKLLTQI